MNNNIQELITVLIYSAPATILTMTLHEFAHSYVSYRLGDNTPKATGRLTLNPLKHIDPLGALCLAIFHFGWAKPVQVNPQAYKNPKKGMALTALAGPLMNFLITFVAMMGMGIIAKTVNYYNSGAVSNYFYILFYYIAVLSTGLGIFNLIPFPPLDGSKVLGAVLPEKIYFGYMKYERYGMIALFVLLYSNLLDKPLNWLNETIINAMFFLVQMILRL